MKLTADQFIALGGLLFLILSALIGGIIKIARLDGKRGEQLDVLGAGIENALAMLTRHSDEVRGMFSTQGSDIRRVEQKVTEVDKHVAEHGATLTHHGDRIGRLEEAVEKLPRAPVRRGN